MLDWSGVTTLDGGSDGTTQQEDDLNTHPTVETGMEQRGLKNFVPLGDTCLLSQIKYFYNITVISKD